MLWFVSPPTENSHHIGNGELQVLHIFYVPAHFHYHIEDVMYDAEHESNLYLSPDEIPA